MNIRASLSTLCLGVVVALGSASSADAFGFGLLGGCGGCGGCAVDCCEPSCCAPEPSCCAPEPSCCAAEPSCCCEEAACCDPCCAPRRCRLFGCLKGLFHRNHCGGCCEPTCGCEEPSCCAPEPSCCAPEPSCCAAEPSCCCEEAACCDSCCAPRRCRLFGCLKGLFHRNHCGGCCEPTCGCEEPSCCVAEPTCGCEPSCGC